MRKFRKLIGCICAVIMLAAPASAFASDTNVQPKSEFESLNVCLAPGETYTRNFSVYYPCTVLPGCKLADSRPGSIYMEVLRSNGSQIASGRFIDTEVYMNLGLVWEGTYTLRITNTGGTGEYMHLSEVSVQGQNVIFI